MMILNGSYLNVTPISDSEIMIFGRKERKASIFDVECQSLRRVDFPIGGNPAPINDSWDPKIQSEEDAYLTEGKSFLPNVLRPIYKTKSG